MEEITVLVADASHEKYVDTILDTIAAAAKVRGTGIARRSHEYLATKMRETKAVIALAGDRFAGFSYIETWGNKHYVTTSGLIVHPDYRNLGVSKRIKDMTFTLARTRWPEAKIFSLTSGSAVMKMNTQLGYVPVTFADLTDDEAFWRGPLLHLHRHALRPGGAQGRTHATGAARRGDEEDWKVIYMKLKEL